MQSLAPLLGVEKPVEEVARQLSSWARLEGHPVVGALGISCADEAEREAAEAFQRGFVDYLLPRLKLAQQAPFRLANLGGRYEPGAVAIAEDHFALDEQGEAPKLLLVKINSHVGVDEGTEPTFGHLERYGRRSTACGALAALLAGARHHPFLRDLAECLEGGEGPLGLLNEIPEPQRPLLAAVSSGLAQAQRAIAEIRDHVPRTPTDYLVVAAMTLNRVQRDGEIVCGLFWLERRQGEERRETVALPGDPRRLQVDIQPDGSVRLLAS